MSYWLMSMNKEKVSKSLNNDLISFQAKKLGVFVNFKDFKGKIVDALEKLINDLKKFGI